MHCEGDWCEKLIISWLIRVGAHNNNSARTAIFQSISLVAESALAMEAAGRDRVKKGMVHQALKGRHGPRDADGLLVKHYLLRPSRYLSTHVGEEGRAC